MATSIPPDFTAEAGSAASASAWHQSLLELRARAEKRRHLVTQDTRLLSPEESQRLVQELQVHQIELEMQCEELLLAQTAAQAAQAQYIDLYDFAPVGYFTLTAVGLIMQLNLCGSQLLGTVRQQLVQRRFALFVAPAHRLEFGQFLARVFSSEVTQSLEMELQREDGSLFYAQLEGLRADTPAGSHCRLVVMDTTARRQATNALAASEARFRKLFAESSDAVVLLQGHQFTECNEAALRLLGARQRTEVVGRVAWAFAPEHQPDGVRSIDLYRHCVDNALRLGSCRCEVQMNRVVGASMWVEAVLTPIELGGNTPLVHMVWRDVTPRREAEENLRREKEFTESLLENTVDSIIAINRDKQITAWNAASTYLFGQPAAAVLGRPLAGVLDYLGPESYELLDRALAGERIDLFSRAFQRRPGRYDTHIVPLYHTGEAQPSGVLTIVRDVTERDRLAEEATQQRLRRQQEVLAAILTTQESERKRIAEAIHNGLGQLLYATKLSLDGQVQGVAVLPATIKLLDEAIRTTRTISFELTPGILEDFGLRIALEELVKRLAPVQLAVGLHTANLEQRLPAPVEIAVYRVVQELLNNVMKHARATRVEVHVVRENDRVEVSVEDNGCGFETTALATRPLAGIGLSGVRNRVVLLGGTLAVKSQPGRGTIISFELGV